MSNIDQLAAEAGEHMAAYRRAIAQLTELIRLESRPPATVVFANEETRQRFLTEFTPEKLRAMSERVREIHDGPKPR